jgi:hypothetical protein
VNNNKLQAFRFAQAISGMAKSNSLSFWIDANHIIIRAFLHRIFVRSIQA